MNISPINLHSSMGFQGIMKSKETSLQVRCPNSDEQKRRITDVREKEVLCTYYPCSDETQDKINKIQQEYGKQQIIEGKPYEYDGGTFKDITYNNRTCKVGPTLPVTEEELTTMKPETLVHVKPFTGEILNVI